MAQMSDYLENALINHVFRNTALTSPTTVHLALYTTAPTDAGGGTQVSGAGYARQAITFGAPTNGVASNTSAVSFTASGGNYGTVVACAIFDASSGGNMLMWQSFAGAVINDGDTLNFAVGELVLTFD